ncbi:MAG: NAD(P)/FAD-dependent oxidoreductase [Magnetovibrionaceae bacterium]
MAVNILIIGAGLSGLAAARTLTRLGAMVNVIEKSRGLGGRLATRRATPWAFDHGAQYVTVTQPPFLARMTAFIEAGCAARWDGKVVALKPGGQLGPDPFHKPRYVGTPGMNALVRSLSDGLTISLQGRVTGLERRAEGWHVDLEDGTTTGPYDGVVVSAPSPQAASLLAAVPTLAAEAAEAVMAPCWAAMVGYAEPLDLCFDAAGLEEGALSWVARNSAKPDRPEQEAWVLHASTEWSIEHLEDSPEDVGPALLGAFHEALGRELPGPEQIQAHRWRYARVTKALAKDCLIDEGAKIAACGDWCLGGRAESAFQSGLAAAHALARAFGRNLGDQ